MVTSAVLAAVLAAVFAAVFVPLAYLVNRRLLCCQLNHHWVDYISCVHTYLRMYVHTQYTCVPTYIHLKPHLLLMEALTEPAA